MNQFQLVCYFLTNILYVADDFFFSIGGIFSAENYKTVVILYFFTVCDHQNLRFSVYNKSVDADLLTSSVNM